MYDENLKANEKLLYAQISALTNGLGYCFASNGYFAGKNKTKKRAISSWISSLSKAGYLSIEYDESGTRCIFINENSAVPYKDGGSSKRLGGCSKKTRGCGSKRLGGVVQKDYHNTIVNNKVNNKVNTSLDVIANSIHNPFLEFWCSYKELTIQGKVHRKGSKLNAEKAYKKVAHHHDDIMAGLKNYLKDCQDNSIYVKHASTFLNSRSWECDLKLPEAEVMNKRQRDEQERLKALYGNDGRL